MVVLGLDPGLARTGYGVVDLGREARYIRCGVLRTPPTLDLADRLAMLGQDLASLIQETQPEQAVVEEIYFGKNVKTAFVTAHARGLLLYILRQHLIPIEHISPLQVKSRLTGYGSASKHQVQRLVRERLQLTTIPKPDDAADALAAALCTTVSVKQTLWKKP